MLNLERLRALHAVATYGSVSAAARALHVTTSAASQQLAKLEREVGQPLLERNGRGVRLTDAAELLVQHAEQIFSSVEAAEADLEAHRGSVVGQLSIAAFPTAARGLAPAALRALRDQHPQLRVQLAEREPWETLPLVARGDLDLAVVNDWFNAPLALPDGIEKASLLDDLADVALPAGHPLADRDVVDLDDLAGEPWVAWTPGSMCHDWLVHTLRTRDIEPVIAHTAEEHATQLALVAAGLGAAIMPRLGRDPVPDGVCVVGVRQTLSRHIYVIWRADAARRPAIRAAVDALRAAAAGVPCYV
ncbi:MAG: LysR family transcriptional regulator [Euzebyales bacterium]|nr:LysR family transcriptional regulator [Euzebyales bacterium]